MVAVFITQTYSPSSYPDTLLYIRLCIVTGPGLHLLRRHRLSPIALGTCLVLFCPLHHASRGCWHRPPLRGVDVSMCHAYDSL